MKHIFGWIKSLWTKMNSNASFVHFVHAFGTQLLYDTTIGAAVAHIFLARDISQSALYSLGYALLSLALRLIRERYKPVYAPEATVEVERPAGSVNMPPK